MKLVIQRVKFASVEVDQQICGKIQNGLFVLIGFNLNDTDQFFDKSIHKLLNLRVFSEENKGMNQSVLDLNFEILVVSQFTLYADTKTGNRPSFVHAMSAEKAKSLYDLWISKLKDCFPSVQTGVFGADMQIQMQADGPVTILMDF